MPRVLIIDDDERHSALLKQYFERFGIELICAIDAESGLPLIEREKPDLLLLDVMLPGKDGFEICREVRRTSNLPVIMLTARDDVIDRVSGLELGADDYITKPFEPRELVARINTALRRSASVSAVHQADTLRFDGLEIDLGARTVRLDGAEVNLTSMEYELLLLLARRSGHKLSRDEILSELKGIDSTILTRSVDIMISRLRQKLGDTQKPPRMIQTAWGYGYVFVGRASES
ncbi:MAG: response regulator transcription factor [Wenzhouxiangella sp.]|jgi:DNA-binding response OmpR family regulator|nr:response regulator transcription factor [Wenzhouxiangella sp.]